MKIYLTKIHNTLIPEDDDGRKWLDKVKTGETLYVEVKKSRNYKFHRKFFALLNFLFSRWEPLELQDSKWKGVTPEKSFEQFRKDIVILAGHYDAFYRVDGSVRIDAKSISFGRMKEAEFEELYGAVIDVGLKHFLTGYKSRKEVDKTVNEILEFA